MTIAENFPILDIHVHKYHPPYNLNAKQRSSHIVMKLSKIKDKDRILNEAREKKIITYK